MWLYLYLLTNLHRATGFMMYGEQHREQISEVIRHAAELCDCLQCFFLIHSMGGGKYVTHGNALYKEK